MSLLNIITELKKTCNHPFLFESAEEDYRGGEDDLNAVDRLVVTSGKMVLLDKLMKRLKETGHRCVVLYLPLCCSPGPLTPPPLPVCATHPLAPLPLFIISTHTPSPMAPHLLPLQPALLPSTQPLPLGMQLLAMQGVLAPFSIRSALAKLPPPLQSTLCMELIFGRHNQKQSCWLHVALQVLQHHSLSNRDLLIC